jgi:hypothetical protein
MGMTVLPAQLFNRRHICVLCHLQLLNVSSTISYSATAARTYDYEHPYYAMLSGDAADDVDVLLDFAQQSQSFGSSSARSFTTGSMSSTAGLLSSRSFEQQVTSVASARASPEPNAADTAVEFEPASTAGASDNNSNNWQTVLEEDINADIESAGNRLKAHGRSCKL